MPETGCEIFVRSTGGSARRGEPLTIGVPLPSGFCRRQDTLALVDAAGRRIARQARQLASWPDGSIKWLLLDFQADCAGPVEKYTLLAAGGDVEVPSPALAVEDGANATVVDTGAATFHLAAAGCFPIDRVTAPRAGSAQQIRLTAKIGTQEPIEVSTTRITVEERGPLRACVRAEGTLASGENVAPLDVVVRAQFFAGSAVVQLDVTLTNPQPAAHPGGIWELGDRASVYLGDVALEITLPGDGVGSDVPIACSPERGTPFGQYAAPFELYQDSSGGCRWHSSNHVNREGRVPTTFRGYRVRAGELDASGNRATPILVVGRSHPTTTVAVPHFWENFPKALEVDGKRIAVRLFPRQFGDLHELQGGERKTHRLFVGFNQDPGAEAGLEWCRTPLVGHAAPEWIARSRAIPYFVESGGERESELQRRAIVDDALDPRTGFAAKRETIDEYGWRNFGDLYADHEATLAPPEPPLVSHYNNQYDGIAGLATQSLRTGDSRWQQLARELAAHVVDIDIYHSAGDKAAYSGGPFWHTFHYVDAGRSSHRAYPASAGVAGGGPSDEHDYSSGLMLQYYLTGEARYRDAVVGLADWVLRMDDGRRTPLRWLDRGATGLASASGSPSYHGPGRGAAYSIATLLNAFELAGDRRYVEKAELLIRRCIHPRDDIGARNLLDAERRWYYTVFLQTLGRYLDWKADRGERDFMYAYARESLLAYARWMAPHERPYLDAPEILEYPNETWVAQDLRKSDVFGLAALHTQGDERRLFLERCRYFFDYSVSTLGTMPTRHLTRPLVLLLTNGSMRPWLDRHPEAAAPEPIGANDFGRPRRFVPQKVRAIRRAAIVAGSLGALALMSLLALWTGLKF